MLETQRLRRKSLRFRVHKNSRGRMHIHAASFLFFTISNRLLRGGNCVKGKKYLDFLGGLALLMLSVIIIIASVLMHIKSGEAFYLSPV